jgi:hypothetical protein
VVVTGVLGGECRQGLDSSVTGVNNVIGAHVRHGRRRYRQYGCTRPGFLDGV